MDFIDQCAIVTGGSSGIGKAIAQELIRLGASLFLIARREGPLKRTVTEMSREACNRDQRFGYACADVTDPVAVREAVKRAEVECGPAAVLINSAGISNPGYVEKVSIAHIESEIKINYLGTVYMIKEVLNGMIERRKGRILNISSMAGLKGIFGYTGYCGSKFAIMGFSEALRMELRPYQVKVSVLCPPDVDTPMLEKENQVKPLETKAIAKTARVMQAEDVARAAIKGLEKGSFVIIPDFSGKMLWFINRVTPWLVDRYLDGIVKGVRRGKSEVIGIED